MPYTIGVDVGGTNIKLGLINGKGQIIARSRLSTQQYLKSRVELTRAIVECILGFITDRKLFKKDIQAIGFGFPGLIDPRSGVIKSLPNIPNWKNVSFKNDLQKKLKIPVFIDNDVNLITLAEWQLGAGKGCNNLLCITLGTGVGGGLIINNALYRGECFTAGEVGHMPLKDKTLERYVGNSHLFKRIRHISNNKYDRTQDMYRLAKEGNKKALEFWNETGTYIGMMLAQVANLLNLPLVVIGGGVSNNFRFLKKPIQAALRQYALDIPARHMKIVRAKLGDDAGILGAYILTQRGFH